MSTFSESAVDDAAWDAVNHQKAFDLVASVMGGNAAILFHDTIPGRINDSPIDLVVGISIGAAIERNLGVLGLTQDQLFAILEIAVCPTVDKYLITPARRVQLLWQGEQA